MLKVPTTKTNKIMGVSVIFNIQNSQLLIWSLLTKGIFQENGQNLPVANLLIFVLSREKYITKASHYITFGFSFCILVFLPFKKSLLMDFSVF